MIVKSTDNQHEATFNCPHCYAAFEDISVDTSYSDEKIIRCYRCKKNLRAIRRMQPVYRTEFIKG